MSGVQAVGVSDRVVAAVDAVKAAAQVADGGGGAVAAAGAAAAAAVIDVTVAARAERKGPETRSLGRT